jgi:hypothetical protein
MKLEGNKMKKKISRIDYMDVLLEGIRWYLSTK